MCVCVCVCVCAGGRDAGMEEIETHEKGGGGGRRRGTGKHTDKMNICDNLHYCL